MGCGASSSGNETAREPTVSSNSPKTKNGEDDMERNAEGYTMDTSSRTRRSKSIAVLQHISERRRHSVGDEEALEGEDPEVTNLTSFAFGEAPRQSVSTSEGGKSSGKQSPKGDSNSVSFSDESSGNEESDTEGQQEKQRSAEKERRKTQHTTRRKSSMAPQLGSRQRRLSSVFNEVSSQIDAFLERKKTDSPTKVSISSSTTEDGLVLKEPQFLTTVAAPAEGGSPATPTEDGPKQELENLRRLYDAIDPEGTGLDVKRFCDGFVALGYKEESRPQLERMFKIAVRDPSGVIQWDGFKNFFRHLPSMAHDLAEEKDDESMEISMSDRLRTRSLWQCPVKFKNFRQGPKASLAGRVKVLGIAAHRKIFAACDRHDNSIHLFETTSGRLLKSMVGHKASLLGVSFCPDRKLMATVSRDCCIILWDATVGTEAGRIMHPGIVTACAFSAEGRHFFTGCQDNIVRRFTTGKRRLEGVMKPLPKTELGVIVALGVSRNSDSRVVMSRSNDKCAIVLDFLTLAPVLTLDGHAGLVWQAHFSHDDKYIVTNCEKEVRLWNADAGTCIHLFMSDNPSPTKLLGTTSRAKLWTATQFAPPQFGNVLVTCNTDTNVLLYDVVTGNLLLNVVFRGAVFALACGVDEPIILCGDDAGNIGELALIS